MVNPRVQVEEMVRSPKMVNPRVQVEKMVRSPKMVNLKVQVKCNVHIVEKTLVKEKVRVKDKVKALEEVRVLQNHGQIFKVNFLRDLAQGEDTMASGGSWIKVQNPNARFLRNG
jgi:hypothetical protein